MMKQSLSTVVLATAVSVSAAADGYYTYFESGGFGPSNWASVDTADNQCGGTKGASGYGQSPVTIAQAVSDNCDTDLAAYDFTGGTCTWAQLDFTIGKNGVKAAPKADADCSFGSMTIPHTDNSFNALQFHIHTYSEHEIVGQGDEGFFPAELHVVHQEETEESFAVFGTMIDIGSDNHAMFEWFLQGWEAASQTVQDACPQNSYRRLDEFTPVQTVVECPAIGSTSFNTAPAFPDESPSVYELPTNPDFGVFTYKGGLTTPACTEIVNWNLLDTPMLISQSQFDRLQALILCFVDSHMDGDTAVCNFGTVADELGSTSRPPQPLAGRSVTHRCPSGPAVVITDSGDGTVAVPSAAVAEEPSAAAEEPTSSAAAIKLSAGLVALVLAFVL